ncbi:cold shock CspA family protein [Spirosoma sp. LMG 31447]|uniref:Cold shock CspA family protein n=1 Tax=Spirosoma utsteinense TaxID=2585773 RepID=A0ABR6W843_9BACT|nr:cold shock CspA family protein [Spirosoma utsteinense]
MHISATSEDLRENDKVTYNVEQGKKGLNAVNVKRT